MTLVVKHPPGINNGDVGHTATCVCLCVFASHFMIDTTGDLRVSEITTLLPLAQQMNLASHISHQCRESPY